MTAVIWQPIADSQSLENGAPCSLTEQFCQWHGEAATFSTESAKSGHRMPTKLVAIQYFGTAKVFLTISTDPANYLSRLAARHRAYGSRPIIR